MKDCGWFVTLQVGHIIRFPVGKLSQQLVQKKCDLCVTVHDCLIYFRKDQSDVGIVLGFGSNNLIKCSRSEIASKERQWRIENISSITTAISEVNNDQKYRVESIYK